MKRNEIIPRARSRISDAWVASIRKASLSALREIRAQAVKAVENGTRDFAPYKAKWAAILTKAQDVYAMAMALDAWKLADVELGKRAAIQEAKAMLPKRAEDALKVARAERERMEREQPYPVIGAAPVAGQFENEVLITRKLRAPIADYMRETSALETETSIRQLNAIVKKGWAENKTVAEVAKMIARETDADDVRAELMARTLTIWSYNEGAQESYKDAGVTENEWLVTEDDALCDECAELDGEKRPLGEDFGTGVTHPPLHPNCRCALLPVLE